MTICRATVKRVHVDYYTVNTEELINGKWELFASHGAPFMCDLPEPLQKRMGHKITTMRKDGESYKVLYCETHFPNPKYIGRGWYNSQGEDKSRNIMWDKHNQ